MTIEQPTDGLAPVGHKVASLKTIASNSERALDALKKLVVQQAVVADLSGQALSGWPVENIMNAAVRLTVEVLGVEVCGILQREPSGEGWRLAEGVGWPEGLVGSASLCDRLESKADYTLREGAPVLVQDLQTEERFPASPLLLELGVASGFSVPMAAGRFAFGVMVVYTSKRRDFSQEEVRFLETVANIITIAVVRVQARKALKQVSRGHQVTTRYLTSLIETSPDAIISTNGEGSVVLFNNGAEAMLGYRREEILGQSAEVLYESEEQAGEVVRLSRDNDGTVSGVETTLRAKDGYIIPVETSASIVYDEEGHEAGIVGFWKDLRERKRWEGELKQVNSELADTSRHLTKLMEMCPDAIISTDAEGNVVLFNEGAEAMLGYRREEILGKRVEVLYESEEQAAEVVRMGRDNDGTVAGLETTLRTKDGSLIPALISASILYDNEGHEAGTVRLNKEKREHKQADESLEATRQYLATLIESSTDAIISTNKEGNVFIFNEGAEAMLGYRREEVIGQCVVMLYESEERAKEIMSQMRQQGGTVSAFETLLRAKDGTTIPVMISASILYDENGQEDGTVGFNKDLRERQRWENALEDAREEAKEAHDIAERAQASAISAEKLAALGRLTAGVSHEVLNPINTITMRLSMMIDDPETPPTIVRHLQTMDEQVNRIVKITGNLLHFGRHRPLERRQVDLNDIVKRTLDLLEHNLRGLNITAVLGLSAGLPPLWADLDQIQQVTLNLLINAREAMPNGGQLALRTSEVQVEGNRFVELRVDDTGEGIDPESVERLFDPFFTTKSEDEGSGLGLHISKSIIEAHSGTLSAENRPEGGASFVLRLPVRN